MCILLSIDGWTTLSVNDSEFEEYYLCVIENFAFTLNRMKCKMKFDA